MISETTCADRGATGFLRRAARVQRRVLAHGFGVLRVLLILSLLVRPMPVLSGSPLPELGDSSQVAFSLATERKVAEQIIREIRLHEKAYVDDAEIEDYLNRVGQRLVQATGNVDTGFRFFAMRDPSINAFAMPGGLIGVHTGLIYSSESESELASVLAHEIAHVQQRHIARSIQNQGNSSWLVLLSVVAAILAAQASPDAAGALVMGGQAAAIQSQLGYSREFEQESDRVGMQTLASAGFDVQGMPDFFERLRSANSLNEVNAPVYLRTHPLTIDRISDSAGRARQAGYRQVESSRDFLFVRAKVVAETGKPREAIARFLARDPSRALDQALRWYGLSRAYLREENIAKANEALAKLRETKIEHAMIEGLAIDLQTAQKNYRKAAEMSRAARLKYPAERALQYREAEAWLLARQPQEALDVVGRHLADSGDWTLYALQARAYGDLHKRALQHRALAELAVLQGNVPGAIEQLRRAQIDGGGDFYEQSSIDARLRELRAILKEVMAERERR